MYIEGSHVIIFKKKKHCISFYEHVFCLILNIADPDKMPHNAAFHLGLHCLSKFLFRGLCSTKG